MKLELRLLIKFYYLFIKNFFYFIRYFLAIFYFLSLINLWSEMEEQIEKWWRIFFFFFFWFFKFVCNKFFFFLIFYSIFFFIRIQFLVFIALQYHGNRSVNSPWYFSPCGIFDPETSSIYIYFFLCTLHIYIHIYTHTYIFIQLWSYQEWCMTCKIISQRYGYSLKKINKNFNVTKYEKKNKKNHIHCYNNLRIILLI